MLVCKNSRLQCPLKLCVTKSKFNNDHSPIDNYLNDANVTVRKTDTFQFKHFLVRVCFTESRKCSLMPMWKVLNLISKIMKFFWGRKEKHQYSVYICNAQCNHSPSSGLW